MPVIDTTSTTTKLGLAKIGAAVLFLLGGAAYGIITHDWKGAAALAGTGGTLAGVASGVGLIKAQDAYSPVPPSPPPQP